MDGTNIPGHNVLFFKDDILAVFIRQPVARLGQGHSEVQPRAAVALVSEEVLTGARGCAARTCAYAPRPTKKIVALASRWASVNNPNVLHDDAEAAGAFHLSLTLARVTLMTRFSYSFLSFVSGLVRQSRAKK
jgi:hypothetical protein